jgi:hypothetical protein
MNPEDTLLRDLKEERRSVARETAWTPEQRVEFEYALSKKIKERECILERRKYRELMYRWFERLMWFFVAIVAQVTEVKFPL